jgi:predicted O-linked N-acetylglucosamine transferase (SPINDLY family)
MHSAPPGPPIQAAAAGSDIAPDAAEVSSLIDLYRQLRFDEVEALARELLSQFPKAVGLARLLGSTLLSQRRFESALEFLEKAAVAIPADARIEFLHGLALHRLGRVDEARAAFERSLAADPVDTETLLNAAGLAFASEDFHAARRYAERVLSLRADSFEALRVLADVAFAEARPADAAASYERALALQPAAAGLCLDLRDALLAQGRTAEAADVLSQALARFKGNPQYLSKLGQACCDRGEASTAVKYFQAAAERAPDDEPLQSDYLFCMLHDDNTTPEQCHSEHRRVAESLEARHLPWRQAHDNVRDPERGLRIGFVSPDFCLHPVAFLIEPVWQAIRGGPHEILAYASMTFEDEVSLRLRSLVNEWQRVERLDDRALAARIRADRIDVLFDLSGHTGRSRLAVFAMKPAPVQVSWIGYPATTGMTSIDYRFVHAMGDATDAIDPLFTEKLVRLRHRGIRPESPTPPVNRLPALSTGQLTFGCFARPEKISESAVALWSQVLRAVPRSRLLVATVPGEPVRRRLRSLFCAQGVASDRLDFRPRMALAAYLAMHHEVDIVLDTLPFAGETTTHHALWMGVPVLTKLGRTLHQNQGGDILQALDMSTWAARSDEEFVAKAVAAADGLDELDALRQRLRSEMKRVFVDSTPAVRKELHTVLREIWRRWCEGMEPEAFSVQ